MLQNLSAVATGGALVVIQGCLVTAAKRLTQAATLSYRLCCENLSDVSLEDFLDIARYHALVQQRNGCTQTQGTEK